MYSNEHAARLAALTQKAGSINQDIQRLQGDTQWYGSFDCEQASSQLAHRKRITTEIKQRLGKLTSTIESTRQLKLTHEGMAGGWLAMLWRSPEQKVALHQATELEKRLALLSQSRSEAHAELARHEPEEQRLAADLRRFRSFDPLETSATITGLNEELLHLRQLMEVTRSASEKWEAMAGEVAREWQRLQRQLEQIDNDIAKARGFEWELSNADSAKARAMVHQACESFFENSKPKAVLSELNVKRRKLERHVEKLQERLQDIMRLLEKHIETLVIDGNNLCYLPSENGKGTFIGLKALTALVPHLCESYKVRLIFDPGICARLSTDEAQLRALFPQANVMVMGNDAKADEGLLAAAAYDQGAYIVSNDRFADYPEQPAIKQRRLLTHIIHPHSVQIQQLQVNIPY
ncbi:hypothetical protein IR012_10065 [Pseudomonas putida]|uniref:hypothetical protein n=1 Tax=Pseudomonas TaxID=286 RepID=UPI000A1DB51F|nr:MULTISPECIES: hypothetical protein [Pseudomonas]MBF8669927.1 hypothetical protein [Pseudomonas putida]MBF8712655.1 hypothetical protein [Pseudomonas putida]